MIKAELQKAILKLLPGSTLSAHQKSMIEILSPGMTDVELVNIYKTLSAEGEKMAKLNEKQKRVELKYKMMVDGLSKAKGKK